MIEIIATLCSLASGQCYDRVVTNSDIVDITMATCMVGEPQIVEWARREYPTMKLMGWSCSIGGRHRGA